MEIMTNHKIRAIMIKITFKMEYEKYEQCNSDLQNVTLFKNQIRF